MNLSSTNYLRPVSNTGWPIIIVATTPGSIEISAVRYNADHTMETAHTDNITDYTIFLALTATCCDS